jgi:hypothetical protein
VHDKLGVEAAIQDVSIAHRAEEGLLTWFRSEWLPDPCPLAADVWVFSPDFRRILVVQHRWRGLVPPGGRVEPGKTPREGAIAGGWPARTVGRRLLGLAKAPQTGCGCDCPVCSTTEP